MQVYFSPRCVRIFQNVCRRMACSEAVVKTTGCNSPKSQVRILPYIKSDVCRFGRKVITTSMKYVPEWVQNPYSGCPVPSAPFPIGCAEHPLSAAFCGRAVKLFPRDARNVPDRAAGPAQRRIPPEGEESQKSTLSAFQPLGSSLCPPPHRDSHSIAYSFIYFIYYCQRGGSRYEEDND